MAWVSATTVQVDGVVIVALAGHLTGATLLQVESHLAQLLQRVPPILVVDLSRVRTCDANGALLLQVAARVAADRDGELRLAAPTGSVRRALRQAGTQHTVRTYGTVGGAVHTDPPTSLPLQAARPPRNHPTHPSQGS